MKNILFITYVFPPTGGAGVQRPVKFVKYLREYGWNPIVLTPSNPSAPLNDDSLLNDIPQGAEIIKTRTLEFSYGWKENFISDNKKGGGKGNFLTAILNRSIKGFINKVAKVFLRPDPQILWLPTAIFNGIKVIRKKDIALIFVTAPPFSSLLIGVLLKLLTGKPWVADFRDEWVGFYSRGFDSGHAGIIERRLEKLVVKSADKVVCCTESYVHSFKARYPYIKADKFITITNGYDTADFLPFLNRGAANADQFTITYTGTVFPITTLKYFLGALKGIPEYLKKDMNINIVGRVTPSEEAYFNNGIDFLINRTGYVEHSKSMEYLLNSKLLLLTLDDLSGAERIIPAKLFEYLACQKPILALVPEGEVSRIIRRTGAGYVVHPRDIKGIRNALISIYEKRGESKLAISEEIKSFSRQHLTGTLVKVFDEVLEKGNV